MIYRSYKFQHGLTNPDYFFRPSTNLCQFLRRYAGRVLFTCLFGLALSFFVIAGVTTGFTWLFFGSAGMHGIAWFEAGFAFLIITSIFSMALLIGGGIAGIVHWINAMRDGVEPKEPGIISEYIRGVKNKYCPQINFVE